MTDPQSTRETQSNYHYANVTSIRYGDSCAIEGMEEGNSGHVSTFRTKIREGNVKI